MKRKGRRHLPKVGTRAANEHTAHDRRADALHPFTVDPGRSGGMGYRIAAVVVLLVVGIGIIALVLAT
jgi:hypothetical protein